ncbi:carboxynorspermidine decarboxylase [Bacteroidia bacterium]|nr:carboxynorspermidine decarboxylase [Bacteroidia bacterium]
MEIDFSKISSPCYLLDEGRLRANLGLIAGVAERAGVQVILALKACAMWPVFSVFREGVHGATASSLSEARLVGEELGTLSHTYAPVYTDGDFEELLNHSSHLTFNSLGQYSRFAPRALIRGVSCGLRINPECSTVATDLYNPCAAGSRLGVTAAELERLPEGLEGFHFHTLCESGPEELRMTLEAVEERFGRYLPHLKWINMGGGHLMTREGYDAGALVSLLVEFRRRYPNLEVILEPGSAFTWRTGWLVATIEDKIERGGVGTLMVDVSFACHMPDCLEMPYKPSIVGAHEPREGERRWRVGGNCCLAGDWVGDWAFDHEPKVGERLVFEDMIHYTMVKTTMFNGVVHPSIAVRRMDGSVDVVRRFGYEDYKSRMG